MREPLALRPSGQSNQKSGQLAYTWGSGPSGLGRAFILSLAWITWRHTGRATVHFTHTTHIHASQLRTRMGAGRRNVAACQCLLPSQAASAKRGVQLLDQREPQISRVAQCQQVCWERPAARRRVAHRLDSHERLPWSHHTPDREHQHQTEHGEVPDRAPPAIAALAALVGLHQRVLNHILLRRQRRTALLLGERGGHREPYQPLAVSSRYPCQPPACRAVAQGDFPFSNPLPPPNKGDPFTVEHLLAVALLELRQGNLLRHACRMALLVSSTATTTSASATIAVQRDHLHHQQVCRRFQPSGAC